MCGNIECYNDHNVKTLQKANSGKQWKADINLDMCVHMIYIVVLNSKYQAYQKMKLVTNYIEYSKLIHLIFPKNIWKIKP